MTQNINSSVFTADEKTTNQWITFGLNSTLRALKNKSTIDILLISADIKPQFVIEQIIFQTLTQNAQTKILCIPNMDELFKKFLKFSCLCLMLSNSSESPYRNAIKWISDLSKNYPVTKSFAELLSTIVRKSTDDQCSMIVEESVRQKDDSTAVEAIDFSELYVRKISSQRAFVPNDGSKQGRLKTVKPMTNDGSDYISFSNDTVMENEHKTLKTDIHSNAQKSATSKVSKKKKKKPKTVKEAIVPSENLFNYITLKVNKIQGNPNKRKKNK